MEEFQQKVLPAQLYPRSGRFAAGTYLWGYNVNGKGPSWPGRTIQSQQGVATTVAYTNSIRGSNGAPPVLQQFLTTDLDDPLGGSDRAVGEEPLRSGRRERRRHLHAYRTRTRPTTRGSSAGPRAPSRRRASLRHPARSPPCLTCTGPKCSRRTTATPTLGSPPGSPRPDRGSSPTRTTIRTSKRRPRCGFTITRSASCALTSSPAWRRST